MAPEWLQGKLLACNRKSELTKRPVVRKSRVREHLFETGATMSADILFKPFEFKGLRLPNRIVMAPMTRSFSPGGVATDEVAQYYKQIGRASCRERV